jgi:hypothetical protein
MRFYLVLQGQLPASGNKSKPEDVRKIRDELHPQLRFLWKDSRTLRQLRSSARVPREGFRKFSISYEPSAKPKSDLYRDFLALLNSERVVLPKHEKLVQQLVGLEPARPRPTACAYVRDERARPASYVPASGRLQQEYIRSG